MSYRGFASGALMAMLLLVAGSVAAYEWEYLGMAGVSTTCIEADPEHALIFVGTQEGFHYFDQTSEIWTERDDEGWIGRQVHAIQWLRFHDQVVITGRENAFFKGYLERSDDLGATNEVVHMSQGGRFVDLEAAGDHVYACGWSDITPGEFLVSQDAGLSWINRSGHGHSAMTAIASDNWGSGIYLTGDNRVSWSQDEGQTWAQIGQGLPAGYLVDVAHAIDPGGDVIMHSLLVGNDLGLFFGYGFEEWTWEPVLDESCRSLTSAWTPMPWPIGIMSRAAAVTDDGRVLVAQNFLENWVDETGDLPGIPVAITFSPVGAAFYVCTAEQGVFRVQGVITAAPETPARAPVALRAWPNPFNPRARLTFELPAAQHVGLVVYDLGGRRVATLQDGWLDAGRHELGWDASGLASGTYLARLRGSFGERTTQLMLIR